MKLIEMFKFLPNTGWKGFMRAPVTTNFQQVHVNIQYTYTTYTVPVVGSPTFVAKPV
jgi:hypothetical protein